MMSLSRARFANPFRPRSRRPWGLLAIALGVAGCVRIPIGMTCEELFVDRIDAPARAKRGEAVAVSLHYGAGGPWGEPSVSAQVDDRARTVTFAAVRCEVQETFGGRTYPAVVIDGNLAATFTPREAGTYTLRLRGTSPTATVLVEE